jgi:hypothetical protein
MLRLLGLFALAAFLMAATENASAQSGGGKYGVKGLERGYTAEGGRTQLQPGQQPQPSARKKKKKK